MRSASTYYRITMLNIGNVAIVLLLVVVLPLIQGSLSDKAYYDRSNQKAQKARQNVDNIGARFSFGLVLHDQAIVDRVVIYHTYCFNVQYDYNFLYKLLSTFCLYGLI